MTVDTILQERGNELASIGDLVDDSDTRTVYEIVGYAPAHGHFDAHGPGEGNTLGVKLMLRNDIDYDNDDYETNDVVIRKDLRWEKTEAPSLLPPCGTFSRYDRNGKRHIRRVQPEYTTLDILDMRLADEEIERERRAGNLSRRDAFGWRL